MYYQGVPEQEARKPGRRSVLEMRGKILECLLESPRKFTHVMYAANTQWSRTKHCLDFLLKKGYVQMDSLGVYSVTERGSRLARQFIELRDALK